MSSPPDNETLPPIGRSFTGSGARDESEHPSGGEVTPVPRLSTEYSADTNTSSLPKGKAKGKEQSFMFKSTKKLDRPAIERQKQFKKERQFPPANVLARPKVQQSPPPLQSIPKPPLAEPPMQQQQQQQQQKEQQDDSKIAAQTMAPVPMMFTIPIPGFVTAPPVRPPVTNGLTIGYVQTMPPRPSNDLAGRRSTNGTTINPIEPLTPFAAPAPSLFGLTMYMAPPPPPPPTPTAVIAYGGFTLALPLGGGVTGGRSRPLAPFTIMINPPGPTGQLAPPSGASESRNSVT